MALHSCNIVNNYNTSVNILQKKAEESIYEQQKQFHLSRINTETRNSARKYISFYGKDNLDVELIENDESLPEALKKEIIKQLKEAAKNWFQKLLDAIFG